jgi:hypothetical protein
LELKALTCNELKSPASRPKPDRTLLKAWPAGYENCRFRVVDNGVLLFAEGKPTPTIEDGERIGPVLTYS